MSNVRDFGATGDGEHDDSEALLHAWHDGDGVLELPPGDYLLGSALEVDLSRGRRFALLGSGGTARLLWAGTGPALTIRGSHVQTAQPTDFQPAVWERERMPTFRDVELLGLGEESSGFLLDGTMQATFQGVLLRRLVHGIELRGRGRNVLVSACHLYDLSGVGILCDGLNLHQAIISASHISYCRQGGIGIRNSEIRNVQITGNDIEYNYDSAGEDAADIWIDASADGASVREGTICSNTIQAKVSRGGANVRLTGFHPQQNQRVGLFSISGNLIGSQEVNVHLRSCRGVSVTGNVIYSGHLRNVWVEDSRDIVLSGNSLDHNPDYEPGQLCTGVRLERSQEVLLSGCLIKDCQAGRHTVPEVQTLDRQGLVEIIGCERVNATGCQILDGAPYGLYLRDARHVRVQACQLLDTRETPLMQSAVRAEGTGAHNVVAGCALGPSQAAAVQADPASGLVERDNDVVEA